MIFVDTGFWYSVHVLGDPDHATCKSILEANESRLVTTDYVVDELLTLLSSRGHRDVALSVGNDFWDETVADLLWVKQEQVEQAWRIFSTFRDKEWSFTDCVSYAVMQELGIREAFVLDHHFQQFGFVTIQP